MPSEFIQITLRIPSWRHSIAKKIEISLPPLSSQSNQDVTPVKYQIPYGKGSVDVEIDHPVQILEPNKLDMRDESELIAGALQKPYGMPSFEEFATFDKSLLVIVNDGTRPTPTSRIIREVAPVLTKHPDVKFIIATGAHRAPTEEEFDLIFGEYYSEFADRIFSHDARKSEDMVYLGTSTNGTEMYVNKMLTEADNILVIGSVEPHYFGGYTGGRKSFLPGVASYETIEQNHKLALSNRARSLALDGNPVHEDMVDALENLKGMNVFSIQTVLTGDHKIFDVTAGDLHESFYAAIESANSIFCVPLEERADIVITVAPYPMDVDLYQSQKAIDNGKFALRRDGVLIFVSRCADGIGGKTFFNLLSCASSPQEVLYAINKDYKLGYHKAAKLAQIGVWARMMGVTELEDDLLRAVQMEPMPDIQTAVDEAIAHIRAQGKEPTFILLPAGSLTIPHIADSGLSDGWMRVRSDSDIKEMMDCLDVVFEG